MKKEKGKIVKWMVQNTKIDKWLFIATGENKWTEEIGMASQFDRPVLIDELARAFNWTEGVIVRRKMIGKTLDPTDFALRTGHLLTTCPADRILSKMEETGGPINDSDYFPQDWLQDNLPDIAEWWEWRLQMEKKDKEGVVKRALAKLSSEEKRALGLKA